MYRHILPLFLACAAAVEAVSLSNDPEPSPSVLLNQPWIDDHPAWGASFHADISSDYDYRGLVLKHSWLEACSTTFNLQGAYNVAPTWKILASWQLRTIDDGDDQWDDELFKLHDLDNRNLSTKNEMTLKVAARKELIPQGLTITSGYRYTYGGFSGLMVQSSQRAGSAAVHELFCDLRADVFGGRINSDSNHTYVGLTTSYALGNLTGWWFDAYAAYRFSMCNRLDLETSLHLNYASSFWNRAAVSPGNGAQSYVAQVAMPIRVGKQTEVTPFISGNWLGSGARKINARLMGHPMLRSFTIVAGVGLTYHF